MIGPAPLARGRPGGPLSGRRLAAKDLFAVAGTRTGAGNPNFLAGAAVETEHAATVAALLEAGADLVGKTLTDELAFSLSGTNVHYGTPVNPRAPGRVPGGSSCGSVVAVADGSVDVALGTDTGGSVRVPASYCGVYGFRPTHGRVSLAGVVPLAPSFDTAGLLAADSKVLELGMRALLGSGGLSVEFDRLVLSRSLLELGDPGVAESLTGQARDLAGRGGLAVVETAAPDLDLLARLRERFRAWQLWEVWQCHGDWITRCQPRFGPGVAARFAAASRVTAEERQASEPARTEAAEVLAQLMGGNGLLALPAATGPAPPLDQDGPAKDDRRARTLALTCLAGLAGAPVLVVPGAEVQGLPVGLAVVGPPGSDEALLGLATAAAW